MIEQFISILMGLIFILIGLICLFVVIKGKGKCIKKVISTFYISLIVLYFIFRLIDYANSIYNLGLQNNIERLIMYGRFIDEFVLLFIVVVSIINFLKYKKDKIKNID